MNRTPTTFESVPVIDLGDPVDVVAAQIDRACCDVGFFSVVGHGIDVRRLSELRNLCVEFFALPEEDKARIAMQHGGAAWRGWFPLGGELTSGHPDGKEGLYFGSELDADDPRVVDGLALHGANLFPEHPASLRRAVLGWMAEMADLGHRVLSLMATALGLDRDWFRRELCADPTLLFRVFRYPPTDPEHVWGVAEHTDYGLLTLLATDHVAGLEVRTPGGDWIPVAPIDGAFVCNLGDMLEAMTRGRWRSTPHRVRNTASVDRYSFPYFFDPSWDAQLGTLPLSDAPHPLGDAAHHLGDASRRPANRPRWDGADLQQLSGTYGNHLQAKVAKVFPHLVPPT